MKPGKQSGSVVQLVGSPTFTRVDAGSNPVALTIPQRRSGYMKAYRQSRLDWAVRELGGKCSRCSSTERLQFHHRDKATKLDNVTTLAMKSWARFEAEVGKCDLLCQECHHSEHPRKRHGYSRYKHGGCRCPVCLRAVREEKRRYRNRRKAKLSSSSSGQGCRPLKPGDAGSNPVDDATSTLSSSGPGFRVFTPADAGSNPAGVTNV